MAIPTSPQAHAKTVAFAAFSPFWVVRPTSSNSTQWLLAGGRRQSQAATLPLFTCSRIYLFISYPMRASLLHRVVFVQAGQTAHKIGIFCNTQHESRAKSASSPYAACAKSSFFDSSMQRLLQQGYRPVRVKRLWMHQLRPETAGARPGKPVPGRAQCFAALPACRLTAACQALVWGAPRACQGAMYKLLSSLMVCTTFKVDS